MINLQTGYIDPSVITYTITAIAGAVTAVGAVVIVVWRRAKKKVADKLGLEEKQKKEQEEAMELTTDFAELEGNTETPKTEEETK